MGLDVEYLPMPAATIGEYRRIVYAGLGARTRSAIRQAVLQHGTGKARTAAMNRLAHQYGAKLGVIQLVVRGTDPKR